MRKKAKYNPDMMNLELKVGAGWCEFLRKVRTGIYRYPYNLNQIPYDYTVEVTNRFRGLLDHVERVPEELWLEVCNIVQEVVTKTIPKTNKYKRAKLVVV